MGDGPTPLPRRHAEAIYTAIQAQLANGQDVVRVGEHGIVHRHYAWAIARSMRAALDTGGTFDTPAMDEDGQWWATIRIPLGRQPA